MALVAYSTSMGPGVGGDATIYITSARNLLSGKGLGLIEADGSFRLLPYFPPGYPLLLSLFGLSELDLVPIARWLNIVLFGGLVFLIGSILYSTTKRAIFAWLVSLLFALSPVLVPVASWAMSEPLALLLGFASLWLVVKEIEFHQIAGQHGFNKTQLAGNDILRRKKIELFNWMMPFSSSLVWAGVLAGLSILTRYNAIAFGIAGGLVLLFAGAQKFMSRLIRTAVFSLLALIPVVVWTWFDLSQTSTVSSRRIEFPIHLGAALLEFWHDFQNSLLFSLLPDSWVYTPRLPGILMNVLVPAVLLVIAIGLFYWLKRKKKHAAAQGTLSVWIVLLTVFILVFIVVTLGVRFTTYPPITINPRMLSPLHISMLLLALLLLVAIFMQAKHKKWMNVGINILLILGVLWYGWITLHIVPQYHRLGLGYLSQDWQQSDTLQAIQKLPPETVLVTNQEMLVLFWAGRTAYPVKEIYYGQPLPGFSRYGDGEDMKDAGQQLFRENRAVLVLFDTISDQLWELYGDQTPDRVQALTSGLYVVYDGTDGGIYTYHEP